MSLLGILVTFIPLLHIAAICAAFTCFVLSPQVLSALGIGFALYGLPLVIYHIHNLFFPLVEGNHPLKYKTYLPWWGGLQCQNLFIAVPQLEFLLALVPGLFSLWLRLWGSKIGSRIYWPPNFIVLDRGFLEIGNGVVFGYGVGMSAHIIKPKKSGEHLLYHKKIRIGAGAFIGAGCNLGPGVEVQAGGMIRAGTNVYPDTIITGTHGEKHAGANVAAPPPGE